MRQRMFSFGVPVAAVLLLLSFPLKASAQFRQPEDDSTRIHRLHVLMNHGLIMFLDGINMRMVSNMKMSTSFDDESEEYASHGMAKGRKAIELALRGEQNEILVEQGFGDHSLMKTTRELGDTMLQLLNVLENLQTGKITPALMEIHHMHLLINKRLENVVQGSNMIMTTLLASIPQIDQYIENQGWIMVKEGKTLIADITQSEPYKRLQKAENSSRENPLFAQTRQCADLSLKIADILSRMNIRVSNQ